jgi:hypothetical protein
MSVGRIGVCLLLAASDKEALEGCGADSGLSKLARSP